ncbi:MAG: hypothetical protein DMD81_18355 [Candidatus Rokuibacteriota bacterium]|nr:MAG: hypothetical protein DMD81_18355 [Candidatus Rokubacteria bacterium]
MAPEEILGSADPNRRDFLKKVLAGTTFAAPVLATFSMEGLSPEAAWAQAGNCSNMTTSECCRFAAEITIAIAQLGAGCCSGGPAAPTAPTPTPPGFFFLPPEIQALLVGQLGKAQTLMAEGLDKGNGDCTNPPARDKFKKASKELSKFETLVDELCAGGIADFLKGQADLLIRAIGDLVNGVCASDGSRLLLCFRT